MSTLNTSVRLISPIMLAIYDSPGAHDLPNLGVASTAALAPSPRRHLTLAEALSPQLVAYDALSVEFFLRET